MVWCESCWKFLALFLSRYFIIFGYWWKNICFWFQVAWVRVDTQTILTIHNNVITRNPRISLKRPAANEWILQLQRVQPNDRGWWDFIFWLSSLSKWMDSKIRTFEFLKSVSSNSTLAVRSGFDLHRFLQVHYEKKLTKNIIPTDIWQIYTSMFSNLLNI